MQTKYNLPSNNYWDQYGTLEWNNHSMLRLKYPHDFQGHVINLSMYSFFPIHPIAMWHLMFGFDLEPLECTCHPCPQRNWARLSILGPPADMTRGRPTRIDQTYHNGTLQAQTKDRKPGMYWISSKISQYSNCKRLWREPQNNHIPVMHHYATKWHWCAELWLKLWSACIYFAFPCI